MVSNGRRPKQTLMAMVMVSICTNLAYNLTGDVLWNQHKTHTQLGINSFETAIIVFGRNCTAARRRGEAYDAYL